MAKAGVLQRQSGIGASPGRPVRVPNRGIIIMKIVVIVTAGLALLLGGCMHTSLPPVSDANFTARDKQQLANPPYQQASIPPTYQRQVVPYHRKEAPGSILVDSDGRYVYYVLPEGRAIRYGAIVGEDGQAWSGVATVARKEEWPGWTPTEGEKRRLGPPATEKRHELAPPHSRTSLARATNTSDKETPSNAAVLRLTAM